VSTLLTTAEDIDGVTRMEVFERTPNGLITVGLFHAVPTRSIAVLLLLLRLNAQMQEAANDG